MVLVPSKLGGSSSSYGVLQFVYMGFIYSLLWLVRPLRLLFNYRNVIWAFMVFSKYAHIPQIYV